jgi:hypothetical protein
MVNEGVCRGIIVKSNKTPVGLFVPFTPKPLPPKPTDKKDGA